MIEINIKENDIKINKLLSPDKEKTNGFNELNTNDNYKNTQNEILLNNIKKRNSKSSKDLNKIKANNIQNNTIISKVKTFNKDNRIDRFGNIIAHGGKQKVSFIDKVSKNKFTEVVNIENYKEYNKMDDCHNNQRNGCCLLL